MACPYFDPGMHVLGSNGGLGDLYAGQCLAVAGHAWQPDQETVAARCNLGYARGYCRRFPDDLGPDAVRFSVARDDEQGIRILYSFERDHRPHSSGALEYAATSDAFAAPSADPSVDASLSRLAAAYLKSYLRRTR